MENSHLYFSSEGLESQRNLDHSLRNCYTRGKRKLLSGGRPTLQAQTAIGHSDKTVDELRNGASCNKTPVCVNPAGDRVKASGI